MNKKIIIPVVAMLSIGIVLAAVAYYSLVHVNLNVHNPISVLGNLNQNIDCEAGETCEGETITIQNDGSIERIISLSTEESDGITTSFAGSLELTKKTVDFSKSVWDIPSDAEKVEVKYTAIGNNFVAEVTSGSIEGYELIYYKDNSDRFNSPAKAISLNDISGNLPYVDDKNNDEYDYCLTEEYSTCHGAKIWYVPSNAVDSEGNIDWSRANEFYFETSLIQFNSNNVTVYPNSNIELVPEFTTSVYSNGSYPIDITIA